MKREKKKRNVENILRKKVQNSSFQFLISQKNWNNWKMYPLTF